MADVVVNNDNTNPKELLGQGIRAYVLQDYSSAVTALSKASELLVEEYGDDLHDSLGDVYLHYGKALLGFSREDSEALGDAVLKKDESEDDEEEEGEDADDGEGDHQDEIEEKTNGTTESSEEKAKEETVSSLTEKVEFNGTANESEAVASTSSTTPEEKTEETPEPEGDPTDLQVAWEVLELAKKIFEKRGENGRKHLADTLITLGEISLESENFQSAINDIKEGLKIQKQLFPEDSRTVAETCYKLGVAYSTNTLIDESVESFEESLQYLRNRITSLEKSESKPEDWEEEIVEVKALIPDIEEKIADMKSYKDEAMKKIMNAVKDSKPTSVTSSTSSSTTADSSSSKPASDISHLVKRKRKLDEVVEECEKEAEASPAKKPPS